MVGLLEEPGKEISARISLKGRFCGVGRLVQRTVRSLSMTQDRGFRYAKEKALTDLVSIASGI